MILSKQEILMLAERTCNIAIPGWMRVGVATPSDCETPYHRFLYLLAGQFKEPEIVELGTREGIGAMSLAMGNDFANVHTFDIADQRCGECKRPNIFFYNQDSLMIPLSMPENIKILFIDTEHDGKRPLKEFTFWQDFVSIGGIIIFDDVELNDSMKDFWHNLNPAGYEKIDLPMLHGSGFGLLIKQSEIEE